MRLNASHLRRFEADRETIWNGNVFVIDAAPGHIPRAAALRARNRRKSYCQRNVGRAWAGAHRHQRGYPRESLNEAQTCFPEVFCGSALAN
jgi:hypothetical protein